jgi:uncharacterized protein (TIGR00303 family)
MIKVHTHFTHAQNWLGRFQGYKPAFVCVLGFTATCLIAGISSAGLTAADRQRTAIADAELLSWGRSSRLPSLSAGVSPAYISRAVVAELQLPLYIFNAGLPHPLTCPHIDLGGIPAQCLTTGRALPYDRVQHLFQQGLHWGKQLALYPYVILSECVVGGTTTALAVLTALGYDARDKIGSSHPVCNHEQKWQVVQQGLSKISPPHDPLAIVSALGDPMQIVLAGMVIALSPTVGVLLAGGTQMLAVYALAEHLAQTLDLAWHRENIIIGTTRWVAEDPTAQVIALAQQFPVPFVAGQLCLANSQYPELQAYESGFVKEGVGAGGAVISAHLYQNWQNQDFVQAIEQTLAEARSQ